MNRHLTHAFQLVALTLLPLASQAAPPPYWPGYPPPPYYYQPVPSPANSHRQQPVAEPVPPVQEGSATAEPPPADTPQISPEGLTRGEVAVEALPAVPPEVNPTPSIQAAQADDFFPDEKPTVKATATAPPPPTAKPPADAQALQEEVAAAIQQGNFAEAYYLWRPLAEAGDAEAQYGIGWMYHNGYGLAIDDAEAVAWWELAAHQGHIDAIFALGMLYGLGEGDIRRDMGLAVHYYHQAAEAGHEDARLLLRTLMAQGNPEAKRLMQTLIEERRIAEIIEPASVISNKANVRKGPGTGSAVLTTLKKGHTLMPLKREGRWLLVGISGLTYRGWIHDSLVGKEILQGP